MRRLALVFATVCVPSLLVAASVDGLTSFTNGTVADADQVNDNFTILDDAVDDNHARLTALEALAIGKSSDLVVATSPTNPGSQIDIAAGALVLAPTSGGGLLLVEGISVSVDVTTSGAGGLDTGTLISPSWYDIWVISDGTTHDGLVVRNRNTPTFPAGTTHAVKVGAVRNTSSGTLRGFHQWGRDVYYSGRSTIVSDYNTASAWNQVDLGGAVPPEAYAALLSLQCDPPETVSISQSCQTSHDGGASNWNSVITRRAVVSGSDPLDRNRDAFEQPLSVPQTTWVRTGNNALANVGILGFRLRD
jgi:hypothetical protein